MDGALREAAMIERVKLDEFNSVPSVAENVPPPSDDGPRLIDPINVAIRDIEWLDPGFVPAGTLTIVQGHGDVGKGTWTCHLAARVTRGEIPGAEPGLVLFASAEDDLESVLQPRLIAAGADLELVRYVDQVTLPDDVGWIGKQLDMLLAELDVATGVLAIDPLLSHISGKTDSYRDHDVKRVLRSLISVVESRNVTAVGVHHFVKDTSRGASFSGQASGAFRNTARSVLSMARHDEDDSIRLLEVSKSNYAGSGIGRRYRLDLVTVAGLETPQPVLQYDGDADKTVDEALAASRPGQGTKVSTEAIAEVILRELQHGGKSLEFLKAVCKDELDAPGEAVYRRGVISLRDKGAIRCHKPGLDGRFEWRLAEGATEFGDSV
jgi:AAA domain-containing protein